MEKFDKRQVALSSELIRFLIVSFFPTRCVDSIGYSGSYPVSKLTIKDRRFGDVLLDPFAFAALTPRDSKISATSAIAFTLRINNPTTKSVQVSFMLNLPLGI